VKTILSVDDSIPFVRWWLSPSGELAMSHRSLGRAGWPGKAKVKTVGLVLTDQNMPRMDGLTLIKSLRTLPNYKNVPILMLTTESSEIMRQQ
jgi:two-component system chemotaxis response regulator CheY